MSNDFYVVVKLVSGEQVMAVLQEEDEYHVILDHPMVMRMIPVLETGKEHITAHPLCAFSDEQNFIIPKRNIMFIKKLHHLFVPHYRRIVAESEESSMFRGAGENHAEDLTWDDELTPEQARKAAEMLNNILESDKEEINWEEKLKNLVEGNDTIN